MSGPWRILVVDDDTVVCRSMAAWLTEDGYEVETATSGEAAVELARDQRYAVCFVDLKMPGGIDGLETMRRIRGICPETECVIITAFGAIDTAITAMKEGALEYIVKPCNPQEVSLLAERVLKVKRLERENKLLRRKLNLRNEFHDILSKSARMQDIFSLIRDVAALPTTVLIQGESGTGKELIAQSIHRESGGTRPFVAVPCAALTESLLESELFGHEKGAFTGAHARRLGKVELADKGTLFLDEIGDISSKMQKDLLRFLQERTFYRVGGTEELSVEVRVIAATHADLRTAVRAGTFREDLFYRLNVINIRLPPLRDRREDIPLLARNFLERIAAEVGREVSDIAPGAIELLMAHEWPGNIRELENAIERAVVTARESALGVRDFAFLSAETIAEKLDYGLATATLVELEGAAIRATLARTAGNVKRAAASLGIDRSTLYDKLRRYEIDRPPRHSETDPS